jgi:hypothetical protein
MLMDEVESLFDFATSITIDSTLAIFGEKEEWREGACLPQESLPPQIWA